MAKNLCFFLMDYLANICAVWGYSPYDICIVEENREYGRLNAKHQIYLMHGEMGNSSMRKILTLYVTNAYLHLCISAKDLPLLKVYG